MCDYNQPWGQSSCIVRRALQIAREGAPSKMKHESGTELGPELRTLDFPGWAVHYRGSPLCHLPEQHSVEQKMVPAEAYSDHCVPVRSPPSAAQALLWRQIVPCHLSCIPVSTTHLSSH